MHGTMDQFLDFSKIVYKVLANLITIFDKFLKNNWGFCLRIPT